MPRRPTWRRFARPLFWATASLAALLAALTTISFLVPIRATASPFGVTVDRALFSILHCTHALCAGDLPSVPTRTPAWKVSEQPGGPEVAWIILSDPTSSVFCFLPTKRTASVISATSSPTGSSDGTPPGSVITLTGWNIPLLPLLALLVAAAGALRWFGPRRRAPWECSACRYDLRGSTGKCPECGMEIGAATISSDTSFAATNEPRPMSSTSSSTPGPIYVIRWITDMSIWTIRALGPDHTFWGYVDNHRDRFNQTIEGRLSPSDYAKVAGLIETIMQNRPTSIGETAKWKGTLGEAPMSKGNILFTSISREPPSAADQAFAGIIAVFENCVKLRPHPAMPPP